MKGGNINDIYKKTLEFCDGISIDWFLNDNEGLLTKGKNGIGDLVKRDMTMELLTNSAFIISSGNSDFIRLLDSIRVHDRYKTHLKEVDTVNKMIQRLIYNRPLTFYLKENRSNGKIRPGNADILNSIAGQYDPYHDGISEEQGKNERYELISLAALLGCWCFTPIIHRGIRRSIENINRLREDKFFHGDKKAGNYNTCAYVCGMVGSRFEKTNQMEDAYIRETAPENNPIHQGLRDFFTNKIGEHRDKYNFSNSSLKYNLYRERTRFVIELFLEQCYNICINNNQKILPIITGIGAGFWLNGSGYNETIINNIIEDVTLSILTDNMKYLELFPGIRFSSLNKYDDIKGNFGSRSELFDNKYNEKYRNLLIERNYPIYHTHHLKGSKLTFYTQFELNDLISQPNVKQALLFAWDGNSVVGNEYWAENMSGSGDPLTVSACCIGQLCNPFINDKMLYKIASLEPNNLELASLEPDNLELANLTPNININVPKNINSFKNKILNYQRENNKLEFIHFMLHLIHTLGLENLKYIIYKKIKPDESCFSKLLEMLLIFLDEYPEYFQLLINPITYNAITYNAITYNANRFKQEQFIKRMLTNNNQIRNTNNKRNLTTTNTKIPLHIQYYYNKLNLPIVEKVSEIDDLRKYLELSHNKDLFTNFLKEKKEYLSKVLNEAEISNANKSFPDLCRKVKNFISKVAEIEKINSQLQSINYLFSRNNNNKSKFQGRINPTLGCQFPDCEVNTFGTRKRRHHCKLCLKVYCTEHVEMTTIKVKQGIHATREKNILLCNDCIVNYTRLNTIECL